MYLQAVLKLILQVNKLNMDCAVEKEVSCSLYNKVARTKVG